MVFPRFSSDKATVESVSREALSLFHFAQQQAYATYSEQRVSFNRTLLAVTGIEVEDTLKSTEASTETLSVSIPSSGFLATLNITVDALVFSPTQDVRGLLGSKTVVFTQPVQLSFASSTDQSHNITVYPKSRRVEFN